MTKVRQADAVNADGIDRIMFVFFLFLPCYYCWYSTILIIVISANVLFLNFSVQKFYSLHFQRRNYVENVLWSFWNERLL